MRKLKYGLWIFVVVFLTGSCRVSDENEGIDRHALVNRHNVIVNHPDTLAALTVGNGEFAFTVDASGLQTFPQEYERGIPLGTMAQWAWHAMPDAADYSLADVHKLFDSCDSTSAPYPVQHSEGYARRATDALRANPHKLHLGLVGLKILNNKGLRVQLSELTNINQKLDLWTGNIVTAYNIDGTPVTVQLVCHQEKDQISVRIESSLLEEGRLSVEYRFPYGKTCHVCPGYDFASPDKHTSTLTTRGEGAASVERKLDETSYHVNLKWDNGELVQNDAHAFELKPLGSSLEFSVLFSPESETEVDGFAETRTTSEDAWKKFWMSGGAIDFSASTDPRAHELERRVVLSQYLAKVQCSGSLPPQETGLTMNSWYGKFHMEMYWWHGAHFPLWGRPALLERSMSWYEHALQPALETARMQGYKGARWQKMTDPAGRESPSNVGAFIIWQQPHPIYLAELLRRAHTDERAVIEQYKEVVFATADFMVSFLRERDGQLHLCRPIMPAQEVFDVTTTDDPAFELQYWYYALTIAREWREHAGLDVDENLDDAINRLAPIPFDNALYLPTGTTPDAYTNARFKSDHPAVLGAYGFLPGSPRVDTARMRHTLETILADWDWESTWGWDYPLVAMTAARLYQPELAVNALLMDTQKNTYLPNGHNYQDKRLTLYLPGNGGLLAAIALMTAGWDGNNVSEPGFPKDGKWDVRWEGIQPFP